MGDVTSNVPLNQLPQPLDNHWHENIMSTPFSEYEEKVRDHGLLASITFLVILPLGVLLPRYVRTFTNRWWWLHVLINMFIAGPLVFASWARAISASNMSAPEPLDHHGIIGYVILSLYISQFVIGAFIHYIRIPSLSIIHRPLQNYFHAVLGLAILAIAGYQVHNGLYEEWEESTNNVHPVKDSLKHAWLALLITFWALYGIGLVLLPRQYKQEQEARLDKQDKGSL
ncbi:hypothetical protein F5148DRAFT_344255 [Russula earlei]|uniref:Uncharacterized protein n=1 Tax=Russula earlei TaxID=71964 RepID=A0ACC0UJI7_9AGAM|nr:hypothetical protein F5148DRAFT_344255 [Russula earlei]